MIERDQAMHDLLERAVPEREEIPEWDDVLIRAGAAGEPAGAPSGSMPMPIGADWEGVRGRLAGRAGRKPDLVRLTRVALAAGHPLMGIPDGLTNS